MSFFKQGIVIGLIFLCLVACTQEDTADHQGYIEGQLTYMASSQSGVLKILSVQRGAEINSNQLLFQLDNEPEQSVLNQAVALLTEQQQKLENLVEGGRNTVIEGLIAQRAKAHSEFSLAEQTLKRYEALYKEHFISQQTYDQAVADDQTKLQQMRQMDANLAEAKLGARHHLILAQVAAVDAQRATVEKISWMLDQKQVRAPTHAFLFDTFFRIGEFVPAGKAVLALLAPQNIHVIFFVTEKELSKISVQQKVEFSCDSCSGLQVATIDYISPKVEYTPPVIYSDKTRSKLVYRVEATILVEQALHYHPGQPVTVRLPGIHHGQ